MKQRPFDRPSVHRRPPVALLVGVLASLGMWCGCQPPRDDKPQEKREPAPPTKADVGVGRASQHMEKQGVLATKATALFKAKEKIVFQIQIPHALDLYKATKGRGPQTHEEFMKEIIEANDIKLPELPPGRVYRFRPDVQELWVENAPAQKNGQPQSQPNP